jgi:3',5'-cyclic AMP phosphodiesterase CpdA
VNRNNFLEHVGWTGAGIVYSLSAAGTFVAGMLPADAADTLSFVQISDSHIGFHLPVNDHPQETLASVVDKINGLAVQPAFVVHTGDVTHLSKPEQFDTAKQIMSKLKAPLLVIPGEHDVIGDQGKSFREHFGRADAKGAGWYSWDQGGTHFISLINVNDGETLGRLGTDQLAWLKTDLAARKKDQPIVVFGHIPLYALYPAWGWTTEDGTQALAMLKDFSSVSVLNGHIHQIITHQEGNIRFATAASTAYPQPAPGKADHPGPLSVPADHLLGVIGYRTVELAGGPAKVNDVPLA